jgi:hypothetical protein
MEKMKGKGLRRASPSPLWGGVGEGNAVEIG